MAETFRDGFNNFPYGLSDGYIQEGGNGSLGGPPPPPVIPRAKGGKTTAICLIGAVIIITAAILIFNITGGTADNTEYNIPAGGKLAEEYTYDDIPDAPYVQPDANGPQIKIRSDEGGSSRKKLDASEVYKKVSPSVVCITAYEWGMDYVLDATSGGSGIILTEDGYIATNSHVVDDSTKTGVMITLSDKREYLGTIVGVDEKTDLAVIKIDAEGLTPAEFADSEKLSVGQRVFAIGTPLDIEFLNSLTEGTLSAVGRLLNSYVRYLQTDAAVNPGNSGGALVDEYGRVIGMNTAKIASSGYDNMGFAIPSDTVVEIINKLIRYGKVIDRGTLSIGIKNCTLYMSKANKIPQGVIITEINDDSPLKGTQVQENDIITAIEDVTVKSTVELIDDLKKYKPDDTVKITLYRAGNGGDVAYTFDVSVKLISDSGSEID